MTADTTSGEVRESLPVAAEAPRIGELLALAVWFALVASAGELSALALQVFVFGWLIQHTGAHLLWMVPVANAILFGLIALLLAAVAVAFRRRVSRRVALSVFASLAALAVLLLLRRHVHWIAIVLLSAGLGVEAGRLLSRQSAWFGRLVRWTLPAGVAAVVLTMIFVPVSRAVRERIGLANLPAAPEGAADIVLIILDTVRGMTVDTRAGEAVVTPNLAKWAQRGVVFERAIAPAPWTLPSHASMFTGRWADELPNLSRRKLPPALPTLAGVLHRNGFVTAAFVANPIVNRASGLAHGFLHFEVFTRRPSQVLSAPVLMQNLIRLGVLRRVMHYYDMPARKYAETVNAEFLQWAGRRRSGRPFFAFLNFYDAHAPYLPPAPFDTLFAPDGHDRVPKLLEQLNVEGADSTVTRIERAAYKGGVAHLDAQIGRLLDRMDRDGILDNAIVIITADHGEEIGEHGRFGHGHSLYTELLSVPLLVIGPGRVPAGVRIAQPVSLRDIPATILELTGLPASGIRGRSLTARWNAPDVSLPVWAQGVEGIRTNAVMDGDYHYVLGPGSREQLFDTANDPLELHDLAREPGAAAIRGRLKALALLDPDGRERQLHAIAAIRR